MAVAASSNSECSLADFSNHVEALFVSIIMFAKKTKEVQENIQTQLEKETEVTIRCKLIKCKGLIASKSVKGAPDSNKHMQTKSHLS